MSQYPTEGQLQHVRLSRSDGGSHVTESKKAFLVWLNLKLRPRNILVTNIITDLADGTVLANLLEILTGDKVGKLKRGEMRIQHLANLNTVFKFLQNYVKLVDIGPQDVLDGNETRILGLLWSIISVFSIRSVNLRMPGCRHMGDLKQRLLAWAQRHALKQNIESVTNLTESFSDGRVLLAILHGCAPSKVPYRPERGDCLAQALKLAQQHFGVDPLVDAREGSTATSIEKIMVMYLTELYLALPNAGKQMNTDSGLASPQSSSSSSSQQRFPPPPEPHSSTSQASLPQPPSRGRPTDSYGGGGYEPASQSMGSLMRERRSGSPAERGGGGGMMHTESSLLATRGSPMAGEPGSSGGGFHTGTTPTRELEVDALRRRCYELEHAANALPATLEKLRELQAYTKDLASQYEAQVGDLEGQLASRTDGEHAWKMAASKADAEVEDLQRRLSSAEAEAKNTRQSMESALGEQGSDASKRERLLTQQLEEQQGQYEAELRGVRQELAQSAEWWRARVDAVRDEEEQHTEEVEEHVESLSQMLVQAEKQLQVTKTALEEASASREDLKRTVAGLERANEDLARQLESKEDSVRKLKADLEDASRTAHVFEEELRDVATKLSETDQVKGGLSKRIESYHTQEDNYRRHASDLVDFSSRAGAALAQAVKDALQSVELLNKVDDAITGNDGSHHNTSGVASGMSSSTSNFGDQSSAVSGMRSLRSAGLQQRLGEIIAGSGSLTGRGPSDIWEVASFLEARVDLAVKAMATLTSGAKSIAANTDEIKRNAGVKMLQLERNLEGALRDREGTKAAISGKDRSIGELEKKVRQLQGEKGAMGEQLRMLQAGEGTRLGDLQRMVESQAYELSSQEASLAEATRHWMNHETATENLQETTQKLISIITSALSEDPTVTDEELNGLVLIGPTDIQGLEERIFREYEHYHTATYHMLEEVVRLLCDRAHALNLSAGKTFRKLSEVTSDKNEANRKMSQARDQLDKAELRNSQLQNKRLEMGKQLGWLEAEPGQAARSGSIGPGAIAGGGSHDQQEVGRLKMRCLELESKLEQREGVGDQLESLMERLKDMATAGVSAVAAARAAKSTLKQRFGSGYEEDKQGEDEDGLANVYDELARFQENLANLEAPVASGSLEFAVLVTGFVVQTLSHELLVQDLTASGGADGHNPLLAGAGKSAAAMQAHLQQQLALFEDEAGGGGGRGSRGSAGAEGDPRIAELKAQVKVLGEQLKAQTATAQAAKAALRESELKHLTGGESSGTSAGRDITSSSFGTGLGASGDGGDGGSSSDEQQSALRFDLERKHAALRSLQEERDRLENELSEALEKVSTMSASQEAGGDMKRLMELENKIADLEEEMENPKALSIHRASQAHKFIDEAEDIESQLEDIDPEADAEAYEGLEHRLKELTDHISLLLNDILAYLKGDVLRLVPSELKALTQVVMTCKDRQMCVKVFKEAHLFAKQIITEAAGHKAKLGRNSHWDFDPDLLENVAERRWAEMMKHLKRLVIAYDNMPPDMRGDLLTFREIIKNLDWLVIMSFHSVEVEEKRREKAKKRLGLDGRSSSGDDVSRSGGRGGGGGNSMSGRIDSSQSADNFDTASMASYGSVGSRGSARSFSASGASTSGFSDFAGSTASGRRKGGGGGRSAKASPYASFAAAAERNNSSVM